MGPKSKPHSKSKQQSDNDQQQNRVEVHLHTSAPPNQAGYHQPPPYPPVPGPYYHAPPGPYYGGPQPAPIVYPSHPGQHPYYPPPPGPMHMQHMMGPPPRMTQAPFQQQQQQYRPRQPPPGANHNRERHQLNQNESNDRPPTYDETMRDNQSSDNKQTRGGDRKGRHKGDAQLDRDLQQKLNITETKERVREGSPDSVSSRGGRGRSDRGRGGDRGRGERGRGLSDRGRGGYRGRGADRGGNESSRGRWKPSDSGRGRGDVGVKRTRSFFSRGGRGVRVGRGSSRGGGRSVRDTSDTVSEISRTSVGTADLDQELDEEFAIDLQRQFISELELVELETDTCTVLVKIVNLNYDYDPLALKYFLEHCTANQNLILRMVVSTDRKYVIVTFTTEIDIDELEQFVVEPNNQFLDLDLDFYEVTYPSAVIVFGDRSVTQIEKAIKKASPATADKITENKVSDDEGHQYTIIAFSDDLSNQDVMELVTDQKLKAALNIFPLYPYPSQEYMHVNKDSYIYVYGDTHANENVEDRGECSVLLSHTSSSISASLLMKIMKLESKSGGDSSGKLSTFPSHTTDEKLKVIRYKKPLTCVNVLGHTPITYSRSEEADDELVGHVCLSCDVPTDESYDSTSLYFLLLTNISGLRKDVIKYYCADYGKQTVMEVYFTADETKAVVVFSCEPSAKRPDYKRLLGRGSSDHLAVLQDVSVWRPPKVSSVRLSGFSGSDYKDMMTDIEFWGQQGDIKLTCELSEADDMKVVTVRFKSERDVVKFLQRQKEEGGVGQAHLEMPVLPCLADDRLYTQRKREITPKSVSLRVIINDEFSSNVHDYEKYIKFHGKSRLNEELKDCLAFVTKDGSHVAFDRMRLSDCGVDIVKLFTNWRERVTEVVRDFLIDLCLMEERSVSRTMWENKLKKQIPSTLYVVWEADNTQNTNLRAYGIYADVRRFEDLIDNLDTEADTVTETVKLPISQAHYFIRMKKMEDLRSDFPNARINWSLGEEFGTIIIRGSKSEIQEVASKVNEIKKSLSERKLTIAPVKHQFLKDKTSRADALRYLTENVLASYNATFRCVHDESSGHFFILTSASTDKGSLNAAEKRFRDAIIVESFELVRHDDWKTIKPVLIENVKSKLKLPILIIDPKESSSKVQIVTVAEAKDTIEEILSEAMSTMREESSSDEEQPSTEATGTKPKNTKKKRPRKQKAEATKTEPYVPSLLDVDVRASPTLGLGGRRRRHDSGNSRSSSVSREDSKQEKTKSKQSGGEGPSFSEDIRLWMSHQYIEFQFASRYMSELLGPLHEGCDTEIDKKQKLIKLKSSSKEDALSAKKTFLQNLRKLQKETRILKADDRGQLFSSDPFRSNLLYLANLLLLKQIDLKDVERTMFDRAAKDLKLQFLLLNSSECSENTIGCVNVIACQPSIQCIEADAIIIAVKSDLYMNQSGIGSVLESVDREAAKSLKRLGSEEAGNCIELPSHSSNTLYDRYIVIVVDTGDKDTLERGFTKALKSADRMGVSKVVCNLIGTDMQKFVSDSESADIIFRCLVDYSMTDEKHSINTLYICETNQHKVKTLNERLKTYRRYIEYEPSNRPSVGRRVLSVCSSSRQDMNEFLNKVSDVLD